ncbi:MAG: flagellin, partial [Synergistaceae bacterium]|nr:flagellin [Synergistaceae bacterium]
RYQRDSNGDLILDSNNNPIEIGTEKSGQYITNSTMLVRSAVPGKEGELYFSGDEELLNALGLNTIQESTESTFNASVYDAHSGARINEMKAEGSEFKSIIPPEIDIHVDPMTGLVANWDEQTKKFIFAGNDSYSAVLHLKNNAIIFQTGANNGEDFMIQLGDMSSKALGITGVNVLTRETASRAISVIDSAINKISSQRAKIGAYTNSLENTLNSLTITSANLTETDSRIRDADMSQAMMNFVKLQILNQSGSSMLAQANQIPQSVLTLMQ